jgi:predicted enzyme related to lactoylglutathione lyase
MIEGAKYVHTNIISNDWRVLARWYEEVFGCVPAPPERDYAGSDLEAGTGLRGVGLKGAHLRLPGHGDQGPTLEIFQYDALEGRGETAVNRPGFTHIAFSVADVQAAYDEVLARGGAAIGEVVNLVAAGGARVTWCYVADPEGNIIELQSWAPDVPD